MVNSKTQSLADKFTAKINESKVDTQTTIKERVSISALVFKAQLDAHITHIMQPDKTLALHKALEIFYTDIDSIVDTFTETYMGLYPLTDIKVEGCGKIPNSLSYFQNLYNQIEKERVTIKETFLQNQIDEMQQLISHTLYRLKYIQD